MSLDVMLDAAALLPDHVLEALSAVEASGFEGAAFENGVVVGMGGSSIGGALAVECLRGKAEVPLGVVRDHALPGFVGEGSLVVVTSYSGETEETLDAAREAVDRGATVWGVSTGGSLGELVGKAGGVLVEVPEGFQPRAAVGWLFAANYALLSEGLGVGSVKELAAGAGALEDRVDVLSKQARGLVDALGEGPVGVVGHDVLGVVARRWAGEVSENAKRLAFHGVLPEMAHNMIVGWDGDPAGASLVTLRRSGEGALEQARLSFLEERAERAGASVVRASLAGDGLEEVLEGVLLGDLVSLHLADRLGVDPEPVPVIDDLKKRLGEARG